MNQMQFGKELAGALSSFQNEVPVIHEGSKNEFGGYSYADLKTIVSIINPILKKNGLTYTQYVEDGGLITFVMHIETGQFITSKIPLITGVNLKGMNDFQVLGSQLTYLRRYGLSQVLGLVTDIDNGAHGKQEREKEGTKVLVKKPITEERFAGALNSVEAGETPSSEVRARFMLTESQEARLNELDVKLEKLANRG